MTKAIFSLIAFILCMLSFQTAFAASLNSSSLIDYGNTPVGSTTWVALPTQPTKTFHRISVQDSSDRYMELGSGPVGSIVRQLLIGKGTGASAQTVNYPFGLSYGGASSSIYLRAVGGTANTGQSVINFFY